MTTAGISLPRVIGGVAVTACGLAHFAVPRWFEPLNREPACRIYLTLNALVPDCAELTAPG